MSASSEDNGSGDQPQLVKWIGRIGGPLLGLAVYLLLLRQPDLSIAGAGCAAVGVLMAIMWMTEALPLPATSLLPIPLFPLLGVVSAKDATSPYADPVIFLFMGGFMLALAMERWGLHKRIALLTVLLVGTKPKRLIGGFMLASGVMSMWVSNTATTVMMLPIAVSIVGLVLSRTTVQDVPAGGKPEGMNFATCMMLGIAYAASIGGVGTIIGTPPNTILVGFLHEQYGVNVSFLDWMFVGVPFAAVMLTVTWVMLTNLIYPVRIREIEGGRQLIQDEIRALGPVSRGEWTVFVIFMLTALAWIARGFLPGADQLGEHWRWLARLSDAAIAIMAAIALFGTPVNLRKAEFALDWETAVRLPWGVLLLFGGGLSLAGAVRATGLDAWIGQHADLLASMPMLVLVISVTTVIVFLTEVTSNTATATTFLPVLAGVALGLGVEPLHLLVPAAIGASCAFMMPVATPPNAIVFGSGHVTIGQMVRAGIWLNLIGIIVISVMAYSLIEWALGEVKVMPT
jgi:sodium-dependent dicarboxylate transporter 2/3/5